MWPLLGIEYLSCRADATHVPDRRNGSGSSLLYFVYENINDTLGSLYWDGGLLQVVNLPPGLVITKGCFSAPSVIRFSLTNVFVT